MRIIDDIQLQTLIEEKKKQPVTELAGFGRFMAYTHNEGPDDREPIPESSNPVIRMLKRTPFWVLLWPARMAFHYTRHFLQAGIPGAIRKLKNKIVDNRFTRRKHSRDYLAAILPDEAERKRQSAEERSFTEVISVLVPLFNTPEKFLRDMIESVTAQTYPHWELCLADASNQSQELVEKIVAEYAAADSRVVYKKLSENLGIAGNTNECMQMASGTYLALFDHDDILHPSALYEIARKIEETNAEFIYTDEATFEGSKLDNILTYHFKPDYSVDNLRGVNYICHLSVFRKSLIDQVGMFSSEYDGSQDHDLIMRLTDAASVVAHVPKILYFWRSHKNSTSKDISTKSYAITSGRKAVADAEARRGYPGEVFSAQICKTHYRIKYSLGEIPVLILIDATAGSRELAAETIAAVELKTSYPAYEIHIAETVEELRKEAAEVPAGTGVVILKAGLRPITGQWLEELLMFGQRKDVGATGTQLVSEKGLLLSSDLVLRPDTSPILLEANSGDTFDAPGYMGRNYYAHNVSAVSGGAVYLPSSSFTEYLSMAPAFSTVNGLIAGYCMFLREKGLWIVVNPYAMCQIQEACWNAGISLEDQDRLLEHFSAVIKSGDPYYNPNLSFERFWQKR